jgi:low affinity Fe/Cu permease
MGFKRANAPGSPPKRQRYWSVMLVGEHGRVIPFRHFKAIAITMVVTLVLSLAGVTVQSVRYAQQSRNIIRLQDELGELKAQTALLRNEKDVLLTKMVIDRVQTIDPDQAQASEDKQGKAPSVAKEERGSTSPPPAPSATVFAAPKAAESPRVRWQADIRQFELNYQQDRERLQASFRIYNTSTPKRALSGTVVTVFRNRGDASVQWLTVPAVSLQDGKPSAKGGQSFRINNYRTMEFNAERQKLPLEYDTATVFVFEDEGALLLERDFPLAIAFQLPAGQAEPSSPPTARKPSGSNASTDADIAAPGPDEEDATLAEADVRNTEAAATGTDGADMLNTAGSPLNSVIDPSQERSGQDNEENLTRDSREPTSE